jgi:DNA polymerase-3 subunit epsilon
MLNKNFTIVDIETTGGKAFFNRIIEIGIIRVERGEVVQKYKSLINPGRDVPEFITELTGITEKMLKKAPTFEDIAEDIFPLFEDSIFVAHNSSFDYQFLKTEFNSMGLAFNLDNLCTVRLSRVLYPEHKKHNLNALIERHNFKCKNRHRAYDDAKVLLDFLKLVHKKFPKEQIEKAIDRTIKKISELVYLEEVF